MIFRSGIYNRSSRSREGEIAGPEITREFLRKKRGKRIVRVLAKALGSRSTVRNTTRKYYLQNHLISCNYFSFSFFVSF